jgi:histone H4
MPPTSTSVRFGARQPKRPAIDRTLTKPAIARLAYKAGAKRISGLVYEEVRGTIVDFVNAIRQDAIIVTEYNKKKTVQPEHLLMALERNGRKIYGGGVVTSKKCQSKVRTSLERPRKSGAWALAQIKHYQKQSDCLLLAKTPFTEFVKDITEPPIRWSRAAMGLLQMATEEYAVETMRGALDVMALARKKPTLAKVDMEMVKRLKGRPGL